MKRENGMNSFGVTFATFWDQKNSKQKKKMDKG